jgi:hypothetical protein
MITNAQSTEFYTETQKGRNHYGEVSYMNNNIKMDHRGVDAKLSTRFIWLKIESNGGLFVNTAINDKFLKAENFCYLSRFKYNIQRS